MQGASQRSETRAELVLAARQRRPQARARLVDAFMPLIDGVARIYRHVPRVDRAELIQEGVVGLLRALERYDPDVGAPFWAYASWWVREAMQQLVAELSRPVVLSDRALRQLARVRGAHRAFVSQHAREPTLAELAQASELSIEHLQLLASADRQARGLDEPMRDREGGVTFAQQLRDPFAEEAFERVGVERRVPPVPSLLAEVTDRERTVVRARFGIGGPERTLRDLGQALGVSAERVRQIEQEALGKMRLACAASERELGPAGATPSPGAGRELHARARRGASPAVGGRGPGRRSPARTPNPAHALG